MPASLKFSNLPAQVYLDNADFSALTDPGCDAEWQARSIARLKSGLSNGTIQCRFSAVHIIEGSPATLEVVDPGIRRLRLVRELCGRHALRYLFDLATLELRAWARNAHLDREVVHADDGRWMPGLDDFASDLEREKQEFIEQMKLLPRAQRRKILTTNGSGVNLPTGREEAARQARELANKFPGFERCLDVFRRFYAGQCHAQVVEDAFLRPLADPEEFAVVYLANFERMEKLLGWMRELGAKNVETFTALRFNLWSAVPEWTNDYRSAEAEKYYREFREGMLCARNERIVHALIGKNSGFRPFPSTEVAAKSAPTYFCFAEAFMIVTSRSLLPREHPRKLKRSDFGDMSHAAYIPHVDYFRCDAAMTSCFRDLGRRFGTVIVPSLDELLDRVGL
jgi:hypothetical protein